MSISVSMRVWLAISSYRNDDEVIRIIDQAHASAMGVFERILIVDSEGTGRIPALIEANAWPDVEYRGYERNLGSGANLAERLRISAEAGADYAYAVNHDGHVDVEVITKLLAVVRDRTDLGAIYPLGFMSEVQKYNLTGMRELPLPARMVKRPPRQPVIPVYWSSSNGALYSLDPARRGILPSPDMWMAWEDLEYGWQLKDRGYEQIIVSDAVYADNYEYKRSAVGHVVDKPVWRTYYSFRNLALAVRRRRNRPLYHLAVVFRVALECGLTLLVRDHKWERLRLVITGVRDGYSLASKFLKTEAKKSRKELVPKPHSDVTSA